MHDMQYCTQQIGYVVGYELGKGEIGRKERRGREGKEERAGKGAADLRKTRKWIR